MERLHFIILLRRVVRRLWAAATRSNYNELSWQRHDTEFFFSIIYLSNLFYRVSFAYGNDDVDIDPSQLYGSPFQSSVKYCLCFAVKSFYGNCLWIVQLFLRVCILHIFCSHNFVDWNIVIILGIVYCRTPTEDTSSSLNIRLWHI